MNFDFSSLNFETLDANVNAYPDLFVNQNGVTFTRKVLEDLGYPAYVLCLLDPKARVFASKKQITLLKREYRDKQRILN